MSDIAIRIQGLGKRYSIGKRQAAYRTLREAITETAVKPVRRARQLLHRRPVGAVSPGESFWALKDVSFEVKHGEVIGIIGRNGAGKSTLLKILSQITDPTEGVASIYGRVGALLEVGTGFHTELTGRENVYLNGAILGMGRAEINSKFDEIVTFAEVEKFIDTPVKHYSSGMYLRLAFAVAAHLDPDILLVDEVLAVGDALFQKKCLGKMSQAAKEGRTVLFVSHNLATLENLCHRGIVFEAGRPTFTGQLKPAVDYYLRSTFGSERGSNGHVIDLTTASGRHKTAQPLLQRLDLFTDEDAPVNGSLRMGSSLKVYIYVRLDRPTSSYDVCIAFDNLVGQRIFVAHTLFEPNYPQDELIGDQVFVCDIPSLTLVPGEYQLVVALAVPRGVEIDRIDDAGRITIVNSDYYGTGKAPWDGFFVLKHRWTVTSISKTSVY